MDLAPLQEPQAAPRTSVVVAQASEVEVELAPNWRADLAASLQALQKPQAAPRASVHAQTRLCEVAFVSDFLAASCAASPLLRSGRKIFLMSLFSLKSTRCTKMRSQAATPTSRHSEATILPPRSLTGAVARELSPAMAEPQAGASARSKI